MLEDGKLRAAAPECRYGPGWIYWNGHCYQFTSYHEDFLKAEEICNEQNAYLADILNQAEGDWIKSVLLLINPIHTDIILLPFIRFLVNVFFR